MSYAIGKIIYGVTYDGSDTNPLTKLIKAKEDWSDILCDKFGFESLYESPTLCWFGIELGEIDECEDVDLETLPKPTEDTKKQYFEKLKSVNKKFGDHMKNPKWMIVWDHS